MIFRPTSALEHSNMDNSEHLGHLSLIAWRVSKRLTTNAPLGDSDSPAAATPVLLMLTNLEFIDGMISSESPSILAAFFVPWEAFFPCTKVCLLNLYPSFCVRGILDMQTLNAAMWLFASHHKLSFSYHLRAIKRVKLRFGRLNPESLLLDPYHLLIVGPRDDVESRLKSEIEEKLTIITKNKVARELLSNRTANESKLLSQDIFSMRPYQPKVAAALYQGVNCALKDRLTGRFTNASSVIQLVRDDKDLASLYEETKQQNI